MMTINVFIEISTKQLHFQSVLFFALFECRSELRPLKSQMANFSGSHFILFFLKNLFR